jgi:peptidyl-prolyl cis-trans isomerase C
VRRFFLVGIMLVLAFAACSKEKNASAAGADGKKDGKVVASMGDVKIYSSDVDAILAQLPEQARARYETPEGKKEFVSGLAEIKLMAMEAKKKGLDKTSDMKLKMEFMEDQMLAKALADSAVKEIKITDEEVSKYYNDNKDKFATGPRVKLRHILVPTEPEAKAIQAELKKGADFSKLAKEKSKCPSSQQGGDLGWVTKGSMVPEFEKAAFELKKGQMSGIVKTQYGYHIIMCDDAEGVKQLTLDEAKPDIERQLKSERSENAVKSVIDGVKKSNPITYDEAYFKEPAKEAGNQPAKDAQPKQ